MLQLGGIKSSYELLVVYCGMQDVYALTMESQ